MNIHSAAIDCNASLVPRGEVKLHAHAMVDAVGVNELVDLPFRGAGSLVQSAARSVGGKFGEPPLTRTGRLVLGAATTLKKIWTSAGWATTKTS